MAANRHPLLLHLYSSVHFFERFSYYGIRSLLLLYLVTKLDFTDCKSYAIFGVYGTLTYVTPLIGGYVSDRFIGLSGALWSGLFCMLLGYIGLLIPNNTTAFFMGLGLIATGSGLYKPNMNALIGSLYTKEDPQKGSAYTLFYVYQNAGSFLAPLICGSLGLSMGWLYGFALACMGVIIGLGILFYAQKKQHTPNLPAIPFKYQLGTLVCLVSGALILSAILGRVIYYGEESLDILLGLSLIYGLVFWKHYRSCTEDEKKNMLLILVGIMAVALSGALISHGETVFTLFMKRNVDPLFLNTKVPVTFIQSIDPLTIIVLGSLTPFLWKAFGKRQMTDTGKILSGFGMIVLAYAYLYILCAYFHENYLISVLPFALGLVVLAAADIFIYPNVLTFCSRRTPEHLTAIVMGFVVFGMALSQLFGTYLAKISSVRLINTTPAKSWLAYQDFFYTMAVTSALILIILWIFIRWIGTKKTRP